MDKNPKGSVSESFQIDLMQNRYHLFDINKSKIKNYYPKQLLELMPKLSSFNRSFEIVVGEAYTARAFFAISEPIEDEVAYQSGFLDLKLIMKESDKFIGEVITALPSGFALKKEMKVKFTRDNILYKPDYKSIKPKA